MNKESPIQLYNLAKDAGMTDEQIAQDVVVMMAGVADIQIRNDINGMNPMLETRSLSTSFFVPSQNPKSISEGFEIFVERIVVGGR